MSKYVTIPSFGADFGTANTLFFFQGHGLFPRRSKSELGEVVPMHTGEGQPEKRQLLDLYPPVRSYALIRKDNNKIVALGDTAYKMIGRTPKHLEVVRCVESGRLLNTDLMVALLNDVLPQVFKDVNWNKDKPILRQPPLVVVPVSGNADPVHAQLMRSAIMSRFLPEAVSEKDRANRSIELDYEGAGKKHQVIVVTQAGVALLGSGVDTMDGKARLFIDIGGGTMNIAIICHGRVIFQRSCPLGGDLANEIIVKFFRTKKLIEIGLLDAEAIKIGLAAAITPGSKDGPKPKKGTVQGKHVENGLPVTVTVTSKEIHECLREYFGWQTASVKTALQEFGKPQIISDILQNESFVGGGGSLVEGMDERFRRDLAIRISRVSDPLYSVINGVQYLIEHPDQIEEFDLNTLNNKRWTEEPWRSPVVTERVTKKQEQNPNGTAGTPAVIPPTELTPTPTIMPTQEMMSVN